MSITDMGTRFRSISVGTHRDRILLSVYKDEPAEVVTWPQNGGETATYGNTTFLTRTEALQLATRILRLLDDNSMSCWVSPEPDVVTEYVTRQPVK